MKKHSLWTTLFCSALICGCTDVQDTTTGAAGSTTDMKGSGTEAPTSGTAGTGEPPTGSSGSEMPPADAGTGTAQCDPWLQDCPDGFKCMAYAEEGEPAFTGTKCTPVVPNPGVAGDPCKVEGGWWTGVDNCDYGTACWDINHDTNEGVCVSLCVGGPDSYGCPEPTELCVFWVSGLAHVCLQECDPLVQDCKEGQACLPNWVSNGEDWVCKAEYSLEEGQEFDPCLFNNMCDPGLMCWDPVGAIECGPDAGCCLSVCDLSAPQCNGEGAECLPFYDVIGGEAPPEHADVGLCGLPG